MSPQSQSSAAPNLLSRPIFTCLILALATLAIYWPVRNFDFINFDDDDYVARNPYVLRGLTPENIAWAFRTGHASNWHPVTWLSHMADAEIFGADASGPHLVNLLFHTANALLLFLLLRRLTAAHWRSALVAALFALHPLHVESVAWISERKDVLSAFFGFLTLLAYARHATKDRQQLEQAASEKSPHPGFTFHVSRFYWLALFLFALGLMSKPMLVTLPALMLLLDYWPLERMVAGGRRVFGALLVEKIPFFILSGISCVVTFLVQQHSGAVRTLAYMPISARLENAVVAYSLYLSKTIWPVSLAVPYPRPDHWPVLAMTLAAVLILFLNAAAVALARRCPYLFTGWFWFFGMLIPVIGLVQVGDQAMADRYTYLPLTGLFIAMVWRAHEWITRLRIKASWAAVVSLTVICACAARARNQADYWQNSGTLFNHSLDVTRSNWIVHNNLGLWYYNQGQYDKALYHYRVAHQIYPENDLTLDNLGLNEFRLNHLDAAADDFRKALRTNPQNPKALNNLGTVLERQGKNQEAIQSYQAALQLAPEYVDAYINLGAAFADAGRLSDAMLQYDEALRLEPNSAKARNNRANVLARQGRFRDAVDEYRAALTIQPDFLEAWHNLGVVLAATGQTNDAIVCYQKILEYRPDNTEAKQWLLRLGGGGKVPDSGRDGSTRSQ